MFLFREVFFRDVFVRLSAGSTSVRLPYDERTRRGIRAELLETAPEFLHFRLKFQHATDPLQGEPFGGQLGNLTQPGDVVSAVETITTADARRDHEPRTVVLPQGLGMEPC